MDDSLTNKEGEMEDLDSLNASDLSFPSRSLPKMSPCEGCGKMYFPWSLKTHMKRCGALTGLNSASSTKSSRRASEDDLFESLSESSQVTNPAKQTKKIVLPKSSRKSVDAKIDKVMKGAEKLNLDDNAVASSPASQQNRASSASADVSTPTSLKGILKKNPANESAAKSENHNNIEIGIRNISENGGMSSDRYPNMSVKRISTPRQGLLPNDATIGGERDGSYRPSSSSRIGGTSYSIERPISQQSISSGALGSNPYISPARSVSSASKRPVPRTPPTPFLGRPLFQSETKSLSEQAREERERIQRQNRDEEARLLAERSRLQKELNRVNDELRTLRAGRTKSQQTISPSPRKSPASATKIRPRFDEHCSRFNPRSIDPSNASSPDNPLVTNYLQTLPHPRIVPRGSGSKKFID